MTSPGEPRRGTNPSKDSGLSRLQKEMIEAERHSPNGGLRAIQLANGYDFDNPPESAPVPRSRRPVRPATTRTRAPVAASRDAGEVTHDRDPAEQTPAERIKQVLAETYRRLNP